MTTRKALAFTLLALGMLACGSSTDSGGSGGTGGGDQTVAMGGHSGAGAEAAAGAGGDQTLPGTAGAGGDSDQTLPTAAGAGGDGDQTFPGTAGAAAAGAGSSGQCFPCQGYWICGGEVTQIDLLPEAEGCLLSGLPGRNFLSSDGTITNDDVVVGTAYGTGARVRVLSPDGSQWLFCVGGGGPCP